MHLYRLIARLLLLWQLIAPSGIAWAHIPSPNAVPPAPTFSGTNGSLTLGAGNDLALSASALTASGALALVAGRDLLIGTQTETHLHDSQLSNSSKGFLSSSSRSESLQRDSTLAVGSSLSGERVTVVAGRDLTVTGSQIVGTGDVTLAAQGQLSLLAAANRQSESSTYQSSQSGLFSNGGLSITLGKQSQSQRADGSGVWHTGSTVGSLSGDVSLIAGEGYTQLGSHVLALAGNIGITAPQVEIGSVIDTAQSRQSFSASQSGLTLSLSNPVVSAAQSAGQTLQAAGQTSDPRMQALAAASLALQGSNTWDAISSKGQLDLDKATGISLNLSLGSSRSQSNSQSASSTALGSTLAAGNHLTIQATQGDLTAIGSSLTAGNNLSLGAAGNIKLLAAANSSTLQSSSSSSGSSASLGVGYSPAGWSLTAGASKSSGNANGNDLTWTPTKVGAGGTASLVSGQDTTLKGAVVSGQQVVADIGGNLAIESVQDSSTYQSRSSSAGFSLSVPLGGAGNIGGSLGAGKTRIDSDYLSANTQSGIKAGDGGFQIGVAGNTDLKGGVITSTQQAIDNGLNRFDTGGTLTLTDLQNQASYAASGVNVNLGAGVSVDGKLAPQGTGAGVGEDGGQAGSTTLAAISGIAGNTEARTGDAETGITPIFDADRVQKEINAQVQITQALGREASKAVDAYVQTGRNALREKLKTAETDAEKATIQGQLDGLLLQERVMNVLIGAVTGMGGTALTKETLSAAAEEMRRITIEDSKKFAGITDGETPLSNGSGESGGMRGDGFKTGGTRADLDLLCGTDNKRCMTNEDGSLARNDKGQVQWNAKDEQGRPISLAAFLDSPEGKEMAGATGGIQGWKGTLFGEPYAAGSWQDKLIEAFGGTHDFIGGQATGLYDEQGNIKRGMSGAERKAYDVWSAVAIVPATPFAMAELLPPEVWKGIAILLENAR